MGNSSSGIPGNAQFPSTIWSAICQARDPSAPEYERHLRRLVELYWRPVYFVIRHSWRKTQDDAKDLTQEFFAEVVLGRQLIESHARDRGSFRGLLRTALSSFMCNTARDAGRQKRGGQFTWLSLDGAGVLDSAEAPLDAASMPLAQGLSAEALFDLAWSQSVLERAVKTLRLRLSGEGRSAQFEVFRIYDLEAERERLSYAEIGKTVGLTVPQVKHALIAARAALKEIVTEIVREYVDSPDDLAGELRALFHS